MIIYFCKASIFKQLPEGLLDFYEAGLYLDESSPH